MPLSDLLAHVLCRFPDQRMTSVRYDESFDVTAFVVPPSVGDQVMLACVHAKAERMGFFLRLVIVKAGSSQPELLPVRSLLELTEGVQDPGPGTYEVFPDSFVAALAGVGLTPESYLKLIKSILHL